MLVAGSVIIGTRDESGKQDVPVPAEAEPSVAVSLDTYTDEPDAPPPSVGRHNVNEDRVEGTYDDDSDIESETTTNGEQQGGDVVR